MKRRNAMTDTTDTTDTTIPQITKGHMINLENTIHIPTSFLQQINNNQENKKYKDGIMIHHQGLTKIFPCKTPVYKIDLTITPQDHNQDLLIDILQLTVENKLQNIFSTGLYSVKENLKYQIYFNTQTNTQTIEQRLNKTFGNYKPTITEIQQ